MLIAEMEEDDAKLSFNLIVSVLPTARICPYFYGKSNHHLHYGNPHNSPGKDLPRANTSAVVPLVCFNARFLLEFSCRLAEYQC